MTALNHWKQTIGPLPSFHRYYQEQLAAILTFIEPITMPSKIKMRAVHCGFSNIKKSRLGMFAMTHIILQIFFTNSGKVCWNLYISSCMRFLREVGIIFQKSVVIIIFKKQLFSLVVAEWNKITKDIHHSSSHVFEREGIWKTFSKQF